MQQDSRQVRSPKWYLFRTAHRLSLNALRDQARASRAQHLLASRTAWETNDSDSAVAGELADSLARLPQEQRGILVLHTYAQMTFQEMASMLDMPLTTVFIRYRQGIESLRRILDGKPAATQEARP
jgi:RNA polymerase sigma-70 factor (ECF subfamily)